MGPARRMQQVEVVDDDQLVVAADPPRTPGLVRRWGAVLLVVTLVLVGTQLVLAARDRAATARLAQLPGVLRPVEADVGALWRVDEADQEVLTGGSEIAGLVVGVRTAADGTQSAVALDPRTGADRWTTPLSGADPVLAQRGSRASVTSCAPLPGAGAADTQQLAACLVTDAVLSAGGRGRLTLSRVPETSRVVVVDAADGQVVADRSVPPAIAFAVLPGLVVVGSPGPDGHAEVTALDPLTGDVRWRHTSARPGRDPAGDVSGFEVLAVGDEVAVVEAGSFVTVLAADGTVARARQRYDRLSRDEAATRLEVLSGYLAFRRSPPWCSPGRLIGGSPDAWSTGRSTTAACPASSWSRGPGCRRGSRAPGTASGRPTGTPAARSSCCADWSTARAVTAPRRWWRSTAGPGRSSGRRTSAPSTRWPGC